MGTNRKGKTVVAKKIKTANEAFSIGDKVKVLPADSLPFESVKRFADKSGTVVRYNGMFGVEFKGGELCSFFPEELKLTRGAVVNAK